MDETIEWLSAVHRRLVDHVAALQDEDLSGMRAANWGEMKETRWLISVLIQHDAYHAGEINHARSLLTANDNWKWG
jgi:DinB superfamily